MSQSSINLTEGSGKRIHTFDQTIASTLVQDQFVIPGEYPIASYNAIAAGISIATINDHQLQIMAGSTNHVRIRRITIEQSGNATTASVLSIIVVRLTTAGTGGSSVTPARYDNGDAASGATAMTLPSSKGTESTELQRTALLMRQTVATAGAQYDDKYEWVQSANVKPIIIPAGTSNGIAIKNLAAVAAATVTINVEFVEVPYSV